MPTARVKYVISGTLAGNEVFSFSYYTGGEVGNQATLDLAATTAAAYINNTGSPGRTSFISLLTATTAINKVTCYDYAEGSTVADLVSVAPCSMVGSGSTPMPNQVALVATLRTAQAGRRHRGRLYIPFTNRILDSNSQLPVSTCTGVAQWIAGLLNSGGVNSHPSVYSPTAHDLFRITQVSVDTRADTQRGRANKQLALGTGTAVVTQG